MLQPADHEQEFPACGESDRISTVAYKRSWSELFLHGSRTEQKKEKEPKRKNCGRGTLVETAATEEIESGRLRQYLLDDFLRCLENPAGFTTVTTSANPAINLKPLTKGWVPFARSGWAPFTLSKARFGDSFAGQPNPWPEIQISAGIIGVQAAKRIPFMR
jgi:hypothetical protein